MSASILDRILATKRDEIRTARAVHPPADLEQAAKRRPAPRGLTRALERAIDQPVRVLAEIKRASPSAGPIRPDAVPADIARQYQAGGAAAISVLTDESYFDGHLSYLSAASEAVTLPILRKDFIIDPYQVLEARAAGADGLLLIVAALDPAQLGELMAQVAELGMDALVEVHSRDEAEVALAAGARLLGVNHRDLRTFTIDMSLTAAVAPMCPQGTVLVGESGIRTAADIRALAEAGVSAILVGETFMRAEDPGAKLAELLAEAQS